MLAMDKRDGASMIQRIVATAINGLPRESVVVDPTTRLSHRYIQQDDAKLGLKIDDCEIRHLKFSKDLQPPKEILMEMDWDHDDLPDPIPCDDYREESVTALCLGGYAFIQKMIQTQICRPGDLNASHQQILQSSRPACGITLIYRMKYYSLVEHTTSASTLRGLWEKFPFVNQGHKTMRILSNSLKETFRQVCRLVLLTTVLSYRRFRRSFYMRTSFATRKFFANRTLQKVYSRVGSYSRWPCRLTDCTPSSLTSIPNW